MSFALILSYITTVLAVTISPGPTVLLVISFGMAYGLRRTLFTISGNLTSNLCHMALAGLGLGTLLARSALLFSLVKYAGALYIIWLGIRMFRSPQTAKTPETRKEEIRPLALWWYGFSTSFTNPKGILFFGALFPLFLDSPDGVALSRMIPLGILFVTINSLVLSTYAALSHRAAKRVQNPHMRSLQTRLSGVGLICAGLFLSLVKRTA